MPSPFPGMDPYLEDPRYWTEFHGKMIQSITEALAPSLVNRYEQRLVERCYKVEDTQAEPGLIGEHCEAFLEIRNRADGKLVTLIDVVSPANKRATIGREAFLHTRMEAVKQKAGTVEIDLLLQGNPTLTYSRDGLPEFDHAVSVTKATALDRYEIYTSTIQKRLPKFKLPLAPDDRDMLLDLQALFTRAYDLSGLDVRIDYARDPVVQMNESGRQYLAEMRQLGTLPPLAEHVAVAAYYLWLEAGCPHGWDEEHWHRAKKMMAGE